MSDGNDPFGNGGGDGGDWGQPAGGGPAAGGGDFGQQPAQEQDVDMNYGQPLSQPPSQPPNTQLQSSGQKLDNNDIVAMVISAFFPGVGHMMLGQTVKGIVILAASVFTCGGMGLLWVAAIVDCYLLAMTRKYRQVDDWEFFPDMNKHFGSG
jgi:TM2 domain-containing membrane protein YozV